jgi:hypothetical protein
MRKAAVEQTAAMIRPVERNLSPSQLIPVASLPVKKVAALE